MLHWGWIIVAALVGGFAGVVAMSMMFVAKDADKRMPAELRKALEDEA